MRRTVVSILAAAALAAGTAQAAVIDGTFNYQGRLTSGGAPITGNADVRFSLWDAPAAGSQIGVAISFFGTPVTGGLFNADLDFGVAALNGDQRWLQIEVRSPAGVGGYVNLGRQEILGAPYAIQTRGIYVPDNLDVIVGSQGPNKFLRTQNGSTANSIVDLGSSFFDDGGLLFVGPSSGGTTIELDADEDDVDDADAQGALRLRSFGGGPGGLFSARNDDGIETVSILGGAAANRGSITMFNPATGDNVVRLTASTIGGRISTLSEDGFEQGYWEPDVSSGGGVFGVWRRGDSLNGMVLDGNNGSNGSTLSLSGDSSISFNSGTTGTASVSLPTDAIQDTEILDEPGVAATHSLGPIAGASSITVIDSQSITVPTAGYVLVLASCEASKSHTNGTTSSFTFGVSTVSTSLPGDQDFDWVIPSGAASGSYDNVISPHGLFSVSAGTNTFYFLVNNFTASSVTINDVQFTLVFFPTAYGTVSSTLMRIAGQTDENTPRPAALTAADIQAEQLEAVAFDQNRRAAEAADYAARFAELEAQLQAVLREQEALRGELIRQSPPMTGDGAESGSVLGHNSADPR